MNTLHDLQSRARIVAHAAVTWLLFGASALIIAADELARLGLDGAPAALVAWLIRVAAWLGATSAIISRVAELPPDQRGIMTYRQDRKDESWPT
jgi:hypothetical protein